MTLSDWVMVLAILLSPLVAIQVEKFLESKKEKRREKLRVFNTLMATRATALSPQHVEALNMIDIVFYNDRQVRDAWKTYLDHLGEIEHYKGEDRISAWADKKQDLLTQLLCNMASILGFDFDKVSIKKGGYVPIAHTDIEMEQNIIRKEIVNILIGNKSIPVNVVLDDEVIKKQEETRKALLDYLDGKKPLTVKIAKE